MTERPDAERHRWAHRAEQADDHDPTGVRTILSSLSDPAPMPQHLVTRISMSLAREQALRDEAQHLAAVHSLAAARDAGRRSPDRTGTRAGRLPSIAVAASVIVLAGAVVMGVLAMNRGLIGGGADSTAGAMLSSDGAGNEAGDTAVLAERAEGDADAAASEGAPVEEESGTNALAGGPFLVTTGTAVTSTTLPAHARELLSHTPLASDLDAAALLSASPLGATSGVADCLAGLLGQPAADLEPRVDAVDVVDFSGTTAVLALLADAPAGAGDPPGPVTAYLVPMSCRAEDATTLHEPVRLG